MQIRSLRGRHGNALGVERQITLQESIRRLQGRDPCQPPLLDQSILDGLNEPRHPPLGLRQVGRDQHDPQFARCPPQLTQGFPPCPLLVHRRRGRRLIGRRRVRVDGQRNPLPCHVARDAVHRWARPFIRIEPRRHPTGRIINGGHQHTPSPTPLHPVMV